MRSTSRDYLASLLDSSALSLTLRVSWALSTELSVQGYGQLFAARGRRHGYAAILDQLGGRPRLERDELMVTSFAGDSDGDGIKDDDFSFANLNANLVVRWEPKPGTTLIGVYTRGQGTSRTLMNEPPRLTFRGLSRSRTEEVLLMKLTLYFD